MKLNRLIYLAAFTPLLFACSEDVMDDINKEKNETTVMEANYMITDADLKTAFETTGTDIAWYATVYIEHSAGTWNQSFQADSRVGQTSNSLLNNNWNSLYDVLEILKYVLDKTDYQTGSEPTNQWARGIAQVLTAYNLAVLTDMWGEVPWTEALQGTLVMNPKYDKQSEIYPKIFTLLDSAIYNLNLATTGLPSVDYIYGGTFANNKAAWIRAANSLKARYWLRLTNVNSNAAANALAAINAGAFTSASQQMMFAKYEASGTGENPWYQFMADRTHLSYGKTLDDILVARNDPRRDVYASLVGGVVVPAPNGTAVQTQGGTYSQSLITINGRTAATPLMTYHELLFIKAEAEFRTSAATWEATLQQAIEANFVFHGLTVVAADAYFTAEVQPRLTAGNELNEILTQKYIGFYEHEAIEAYNDYRRTGIPTMHNPKNLTVGFVNRIPWALSEISSNSKNVPETALEYIYTDKVWWAGGTELVP